MTIIEDHDQYTISKTDDGALLFDWKSISGLNATDFASGINRFATQCEAERPSRAVIDARQLDQTSQAAKWLRNQEAIEGLDAYQAWWEREIIPLYNAAGIDALTVATGDPNAPGEIPAPEQARFAVAYLTDVDSARTWQPA